MAMITAGDVRETRMANVVAGTAANSTLYYYLPILHYRSLGLSLEWTPGSGGGSVIATVEAAVCPICYASTPGDQTTLSYVDVTNAVFGAATFTDDFIKFDTNHILAAASWIRVKIVVSNKDAATAYALYARQAG